MQKGKMRFIEVETKNRTADFINRLLTVWESSVRATHLFLSDSEIKKIKEYVPQALAGIAHLMIAEDDRGCPGAFMNTWAFRFIKGQTLTNRAILIRFYT